MIRPTINVFFIATKLLQIVHLNMYLNRKLLFYKVGYLIYLYAWLSVVFASSLQISAAHKPAKLFDKILIKNLKQKFNFKFKSKVINSFIKI